ncbi:MAG TPA: PQQ-dependent sugar dehydrogenase [Gemmatimonadaceae bacterium]|nr:PQQ-dependent sugar dehydrogenase [Gemmatimonadaceae bacterium]
MIRETVRLGALVLAIGGALAACGRGEKPAADAGGTTSTASGTLAGCARDDGGLRLPDGFCATIFADSVGGARHVAIAPNGDVFVQLISAKRGAAGARGGILALRDTDHDGRADTSASFGEAGGTGIALGGGYLYADARTRIVRYPLPAGSLVPSGDAEAIVVDLPTGGHEARNFALDGSGALYLNVGSATNSCQVKDRVTGSPGHDPCTELETRAGIWKFDAARAGQTQRTGTRFATGIRNAMGLVVNPANGALYATQHGRDQLFQNWPKYFDAQHGAENPAEELVQVRQGDDFGWPYCYYDRTAKRLVLAPEYGGDGHTVGRCAQKKEPLAVFPGHWAPMSALFYTGEMFPARYRGGVFIAFHGSWNRAPEPQAGYSVVFVPMRDGRPSGQYEPFADGFAGATKSPSGAAHRPVGLAVAPDGALFVTDDKGGRIWRITYQGSR